MTRRIELGDFPVSFAASLTVRKVGIVGEGSGKAQPTRVREVGNRFQRRSMPHVKETRRYLRDPLPRRFRLACGLVPNDWNGVAPEGE